MDVERRQSPRRATDTPVQVQANERVFAARIRSLSKVGALVQLDSALPAGTPLILAITTLQSNETVEVRAQVVRIEYSGSSSAVSVMFGPLAAPALAAISALLEE